MMIENKPSTRGAVLETLGVICREKPREAVAREKRQAPISKEKRGETGHGSRYNLLWALSRPSISKCFPNEA